MKRYNAFWTTTMIRGALAIFTGSAIIVMPDMARTILLLPFALAFSILCLVAYGVIDSGLVLVTSFMTPLRPARWILRAQGVAGISLGALLFFLLYEKVRLHLFFYLIALQALLTAWAEFVVARHTSQRHGSRLSYAAAAAATICAAGYAVSAWSAELSLSPHQIAWLIYAYLGAFGVAQTVNAARMLYLARHRSTNMAEAH